MISAGQTNNPNPGYAPARPYQTPTIGMGNATPLQNLPTSSGFKFDFGNDKTAGYIGLGVEAGKHLLNAALIAPLNAWLQGKALDGQRAIAEKYYDTQDKIAGYQQKVALRQLDVQETAIFVQQAMHRDQIGHEERMMKLEGATQARLARIHEDGKTARARVLAVTDAFSRRGYNMGVPREMLLS